MSRTIKDGSYAPMLQGVSQQVEHERLPGQVQEQINSINSARQAKASEARLNELTRKLAESVASEVLALRKSGDSAKAAALVAEARKQLPDEPALRAL